MCVVLCFIFIWLVIRVGNCRRICMWFCCFCGVVCVRLVFRCVLKVWWSRWLMWRLMFILCCVCV